MPKISVLMPVYNAEDYLKIAIESVLNQTYKDFEFIIINDGSSDGSEEIIKSFDDERIKYIKNEENLRIIRTLNKGLKLCEGEYIARMDADDICLPHRFEKQIEYMEKHKDVGVLGSWVKNIGISDAITKFSSNYKDVFYSFLTTTPTIPHPAAMIRKSVLVDNNLEYDMDYIHAEDFKLWNEIKHVSKIINYPEVLLQYRVHNESISKQNKEVQNEIRYKIVKEEFERCFNAEYKEIYTYIIAKRGYSYPVEDLVSFIKAIKLYKNRSFKFNLIKKYIRKNMKHKYDIISFIKLFRISFVYYLLLG